jgi:hypothetical protein
MINVRLKSKKFVFLVTLLLGVVFFTGVFRSHTHAAPVDEQNCTSGTDNRCYLVGSSPPSQQSPVAPGTVLHFRYSSVVFDNNNSASNKTQELLTWANIDGKDNNIAVENWNAGWTLSSGQQACITSRDDSRQLNSRYFCGYNVLTDSTDWKGKALYHAPVTYGNNEPSTADPDRYSLSFDVRILGSASDNSSVCVRYHTAPFQIATQAPTFWNGSVQSLIDAQNNGIGPQPNPFFPPHGTALDVNPNLAISENTCYRVKIPSTPPTGTATCGNIRFGNNNPYLGQSTTATVTFYNQAVSADWYVLGADGRYHNPDGSIANPSDVEKQHSGVLMQTGESHPLNELPPGQTNWLRHGHSTDRTFTVSNADPSNMTATYDFKIHNDATNADFGPPTIRCTGYLTFRPPDIVADCKTTTVINPGNIPFNTVVYDITNNPAVDVGGITGGTPPYGGSPTWDTFNTFQQMRPHRKYAINIVGYPSGAYLNQDSIDKCMSASCGPGSANVSAIEPGEAMFVRYGIRIRNDTNRDFPSGTYSAQVSDNGGFTLEPSNPPPYTAPFTGPYPPPVDLDGGAAGYGVRATYTGSLHADLLYGATNINSFFGLNCNSGSSPRTRPYINVQGGDISAGGGFAYKHADGSVSCPTNTETGRYFSPTSVNKSTGVDDLSAGGIRTYAAPVTATSAYKSSADFAAFALGMIDGSTSSSSRFGFYSDRFNGTHRGLTFANADSSPSALLGNLGGRLDGGNPNAHCATDYFDTTPAKTVKLADFDPVDNFKITPGTASDQYFIKQAAGAPYIEIGASGNNKVGRGKSITVYVIGNVYITKDITYENWGFDYTHQTNDSPYFTLVVQGNISVAPGVSRLDGLYIAQPNNAGAGGNFATCSLNGVSNANKVQVSDSCQTVLKVNGSVIAQHVFNVRAKGSLVDAGAPGAEATETYDFMPSIIIGQPNFNTTDSLDGLESRPPVF